MNKNIVYTVIYQLTRGGLVQIRFGMKNIKQTGSSYHESAIRSELV